MSEFLYNLSVWLGQSEHNQTIFVLGICLVIFLILEYRG